MNIVDEPTCTAFLGAKCLASGTLAEVAKHVKSFMDKDEQLPVLIFDDTTARPIEVDFRGSLEEVLARLPIPEGEEKTALPASPRGPGRPKLGVVAREVTLLQRHWDWLATQPGGASVALRRLVEEARRTLSETDRRRHAQEAAYRFMAAMAGNEPGFEEATRALFAGNAERFAQETEAWQADLRDYTRKLAAAALIETGPAGV